MAAATVGPKLDTGTRGQQDMKIRMINSPALKKLDTDKRRTEGAAEFRTRKKLDTDIGRLKDIDDSSTETKNWTQEKAGTAAEIMINRELPRKK